VRRKQSRGDGPGVLPLAVGSVVMLTCVFRFGTRGEGTPFPGDPPRKLVAVGPYQYSRNPMYLGMAVALIGEAVLYAGWSQWQRIAIYALVLAVIMECFVVFYEEPTLRTKFGKEYEEYYRRVPRWIGRRHQQYRTAEQGRTQRKAGD
jgi:protein-S-isoprenylcysteine O-methyltransferase Ste14